MKRFSGLLVLVFVFAFLSTAWGQEQKVINGGVLNGKATRLPKPEYPEAAKAGKVEGMIAVNVEIDENGMIASAKADLYDQRPRLAADGTKLDPVLADSMLRDAAEEAARAATFSPTRMNGQPVRVKGRIVYNFVNGDAVATAPSGEA